MTIQLARWEREELEAILREALEADPDQRPSLETAQRAIEQIDAAERAGRDWPAIVRGNALEESVFRAQKVIAKRVATVLVSHDGQIVAKSTRVGRKIRREDGREAFQQALFVEMSWDEFFRWVRMISSQVAGLTANLSMAARVARLQEAVPDSSGPGDAAQRLGTTVEAWIEAAS